VGGKTALQKCAEKDVLQDYDSDIKIKDKI
jgi:hypothetical protein